jgi:hypothetical protein
MPQRFLRPGITNSERWNAVAPSTANFFIRILTLVDDFGQYDARASVLLGNCFSVWNLLHPNDAYDLKRVENELQQLAATQLIELYETKEGKRFLQVSQWQERVREGCKRKWPQNAKVAATCSNLLPPSSPPSPSPTPSSPSSGPSAREQNFENIKSRLQSEYGSKRILSNFEESTLNEIARRPDSPEQLAAVFAYRDSLPPKDRRFFPQSIRSLLEKWDETLDRAHVTLKLNGHTNTILDQDIARLRRQAERL